MSYKETKKMIESLVGDELVMADKNFPLFASNHEGESVIREELHEAEREITRCKDWYHALESGVFQDMSEDAVNCAAELEKQAVFLACEAVQLAAMARKFRISYRNRQPVESDKPKRCANCANRSVDVLCNPCFHMEHWKEQKDE